MKPVIIVGAGLAALRTAEALRASAWNGPITVVGEEVHPPYNRPPLGPTVTDDSRPSSVLLGFSRVCIEPGASVDVSVWVDAAPLSVWNGEQLVLPQCPIAAQVGRWQGDPNATRVTLS